MNRWRAVAHFAALAAITALGLLAPAVALPFLAVGVVAALRRGRRAFLLFVLLSLAINTLLFALLVPGPEGVSAGPLHLNIRGAWLGLRGGLRLAAVAGGNFAFLSWFPLEPALDGLRVGPTFHAYAGAVWIAAHDVARDLQRLVVARKLAQDWPKGRIRRIAASARLLAPLIVLGVRRAETRSDALRLAGHDMGARFALVVAVSALAAAARLPLAAIPNVSLTYVVVFLGGLLFGPTVGALGGLLSMVLTDVLMTGLLPMAFVNAPAMAALGLLGGLLRGVDFVGGSRIDRSAGLLFAACAGLAATFVFSVAADTLTWLLVPDYGASLAAWRALVLAGLAFNVLPALANAFLFAAAIVPATKALRAFQSTRPATQRADGTTA